AGLDVGRGGPADGVVVEELLDRPAHPQVRTIERHLVREVGVGGGDDTIGIGRDVADGVDGRAAEAMLAVAIQAQHVALAVPRRRQIDAAVLADGEAGGGNAESGVFAMEDLLNTNLSAQRGGEQEQAGEGRASTEPGHGSSPGGQSRAVQASYGSPAASTP